MKIILENFQKTAMKIMPFNHGEGLLVSLAQGGRDNAEAPNGRFRERGRRSSRVLMERLAPQSKVSLKLENGRGMLGFLTRLVVALDTPHATVR